MAAILIIDDELVLAHELSVALESAGHEVHTAATAATGLDQATQLRPDVVLLDLRLPDRSGLELIPDLLRVDSSSLIVLMTAYGSVRDAVEAMRRGAADYLNKPLDVGELGLLVERLLRQQRRERELVWLRERTADPANHIWAGNQTLQVIFGQVGRLCDAGLPPSKRPPILLSGETGAGKGVIARAIHASLGDGPFIEVACGSMPPTDLERELFGEETPANGASGGSHPGLFEAAEGGTLFLDEVADLDGDMQARLLRVLQSRQVRRVGSARDRDIDVHIMAATHQDLERRAQEGRFRSDLLHRLRVLAFEIPPLRERREELPELAQRFADEIGQKYGHELRLSPEAVQELEGYDWPGNVRELRNVIERAALLAEGPELQGSVFATLLRGEGVTVEPGKLLLPKGGLRLDDVERDLLKQALERARGNRTRASALLGLSRDTLRYRIAKWGLDTENPA